jgi:hypothetical protein
MSTVIDGSAGVTTNTGAVYNGIQSATAQASTSGTSIDFTSIPSWVKRITVMFNGVSTSGTSSVQIQIGSGSVTTSGYVSSCSYITSGSGTDTSTAAFKLVPGAAQEAAQALGGGIVITNVSGNIWSSFGVLGKSATTPATLTSAGVVTLSGTLDRVRVTTVGGTDTFDAGSINILYE